MRASQAALRPPVRTYPALRIIISILQILAVITAIVTVLSAYVYLSNEGITRLVGVGVLVSGLIGTVMLAAIAESIVLLVDIEQNTRMAAIAAVTAIDPVAPVTAATAEEDVLTLTNELASSDPKLREHAASRLGDLGAVAAAAVPRLKELAADPNRTVRTRAAWAVERITKQLSAK